MIKIKDTLISGIIAGWIGNVVKEALAWSFFFLGWINYTFIHIGAGLYYSKENLDSPLSLLTGIIIDWTLAGLFGVMLLYLLRYTGSDYAVWKGIGLGSLTYIIAFGVGIALEITRATLLTSLPHFFLLLTHLIIGAVSGWVIEKYFNHVL